MNIISKYLEQLQIEQIAVNLISKAVSLILLFLFFLIVKRVADFIFKHAVEKSITLSRQTEARQKTISKLLHNIMNYTIYFFLLYWVLSILGVPVSSLLAGAGLAGVAIGLGAQGFLTDVVNGFFILLENQFEVGDSVVIGTVEGNISSVGIRTTQIRGFDGTLHFIPNRNITVVSNKSRGDMRVQIDIPIYAHTDLEKISNIIKTINKEQLPSYPEIVGSPTILGPRTNSTAQLVFRVDIFVQNGKQSYIYSNFYRLYQEALLENDIALPTMYANPTLTK
ncbi:mechanosensitive ion channel protein [Streptococcus gallolyticus subsp. gallolyticus]|uniref:mechanosensitive ion channel family protein n=1 Tax=Streptococcus gallolyticus TaxID=315405 RepID=UPI0007E38865|nr:mechanosensitive ion channel family protein [Streptococcus gallolyticus]MCY7179533.1 mechanosensitive ion channel family protein [Streptococcus gallolyticus subsp. gallolyticus]MCY7194940.1 mechanosensitive ion channel family protein [Streptococcus gallolyticus subsp. gallolyticus]OAV84521.1 mechanosensitive ion channel protein [Streptococcus gallolyticus subsp. gallolyticus]OCW50152.1 mechanosensitive ion channel protein [Streptococcus gallolyticus subsp. gallolyticus]